MAWNSMLWFFLKTVNLFAPFLPLFTLLTGGVCLYPSYFSFSPHFPLLQFSLFLFLSNTDVPCQDICLPSWNIVKWIFMRPPTNTTDLSCCKPRTTTNQERTPRRWRYLRRGKEPREGRTKGKVDRRRRMETEEMEGRGREVIEMEEKECKNKGRAAGQERSKPEGAERKEMRKVGMERGMSEIRTEGRRKWGRGKVQQKMKWKTGKEMRCRRRERVRMKGKDWRDKVKRGGSKKKTEGQKERKQGKQGGSKEHRKSEGWGKRRSSGEKKGWKTRLDGGNKGMSGERESERSREGTIKGRSKGMRKQKWASR